MQKGYKITHLCFANDLMLFCHAAGKSLSILLEPFGKFQNWFGLKMNHAKSNIFFGGISKEDIDKRRDIAKIDEGKLPIRYLGVPLVSIELSIDDCQPLIEKILGRISSWKCKFL